ncbi:hypothetical protein FGO68_gene2472 [Halteria grandinella]|uniref:Uncharacterized protein n=1 Tax=Halteria grandinella TaxID=5974 RepID=A0A8J8NYF2_HALGN|nr:hypothetical protein FGO68_gene2472 [Halteria grandinella]
MREGLFREFCQKCYRGLHAMFIYLQSATSSFRYYNILSLLQQALHKALPHLYLIPRPPYPRHSIFSNLHNCKAHINIFHRSSDSAPHILLMYTKYNLCRWLFNFQEVMVLVKDQLIILTFFLDSKEF